VVCDEIHAPLVLPGAAHTSYLDLDGTHDHAVAVVAASKAFNTAGLRCAQLLVPDAGARERLAAPPPGGHGPWAPVGGGGRPAGRRAGGPPGWRPGRGGSPTCGPCGGRCWPSTCRWPGCGRSRRRTSCGSTPGPTATTTPPRWPWNAAASSSAPVTTSRQ